MFLLIFGVAVVWILFIFIYAMSDTHIRYNSMVKQNAGLASKPLISKKVLFFIAGFLFVVIHLFIL